MHVPGQRWSQRLCDGTLAEVWDAFGEGVWEMLQSVKVRACVYWVLLVGGAAAFGCGGLDTRHVVIGLCTATAPENSE